MKKFLTMTALVFATCGAAQAETEATGEVFARIGDTVLTQDMLDAAFSRIPEEHRLTFIRDGKKVDQLVKQILTNMVMADQAREAGFDKTPLVAGRVELAENKALTEAWLDEKVRQTPDPDYEALAREYYLVHPEQFMTEPTWDVTHLLIKPEGRGEAEARLLAEDLLEKVNENPDAFDQLVKEYSEDRTVEDNGGRLTGLRNGQTVKAFEAAMKALQNPGDFSGVVKTQFGYHIIRLDGKKAARQMSFDEVKPAMIAREKSEFKDKSRTRYITEAISKAPLEFEEGAVEKMLKRYFGENLENAPDYNP